MADDDRYMLCLSYQLGQSYSQDAVDERQKLAQAKRMGVFMTYLTDAEEGGT